MRRSLLASLLALTVVVPFDARADDGDRVLRQSIEALDREPTGDAENDLASAMMAAYDGPAVHRIDEAIEAGELEPADLPYAAARNWQAFHRQQRIETLQERANWIAGPADITLADGVTFALPDGYEYLDGGDYAAMMDEVAAVERDEFDLREERHSASGDSGLLRPASGEWMAAMSVVDSPRIVEGDLVAQRDHLLERYQDYFDDVMDTLGLPGDQMVDRFVRKELMGDAWYARWSYPPVLETTPAMLSWGVTRAPKRGPDLAIVMRLGASEVVGFNIRTLIDSAGAIGDVQAIASTLEFPSGHRYAEGKDGVSATAVVDPGLNDSDRGIQSAYRRHLAEEKARLHDLFARVIRPIVSVRR
ncbi:hypothetical protein [Salinicola halophilus]|uniref:hypothetical protein n=1 Tax=Salinicola halophilus TaxID=184065 RepID=UPI000DA1AED4|nr:hypothetical protein [Salinicola halophilus]